MTNFISIRPLIVGYTTAMEGEANLFNSDLPLEQQTWASASEKEQCILVGFDGVYELTSLYMLEFGSDQTTQGVSISARGIEPGFKLAEANFFQLDGANIRRGAPNGGGFSVDNTGDAYRPIRPGFRRHRTMVDSQSVRLGVPGRYIGVRYRISGHGRFSAAGFEIGGNLVSKYDADDRKAQENNIAHRSKCAVLRKP